ncbi:hypothetical protein CANCADRAFT_30408 [Tortispora caseinolytica NRRL Y-17796]|uniref:Large ribosomal subunit protein bL32m n=1 Tax=Tortispora caseinolytica NRRL Y-17796 TaxID=767744 RepID=A0A1E4TK77_9ASCO|nr:hypothetical protein CANCADRAFT_30408 [Tortispora caseinolytica NRRL Y-17796]
MAAIQLSRLPSLLLVDVSLRHVALNLPRQDLIAGNITRSLIPTDIFKPSHNNLFGWTLKRLGQALEQWSGILWAAPKKRSSYAKKRKRLLAPARNQVKPTGPLEECQGCGRYKRKHTVCMPCVDDIKTMWNKESRNAKKGEETSSEIHDMIYPKLHSPAYDHIRWEMKNWVPQRQKPLKVKE